MALTKLQIGITTLALSVSYYSSLAIAQKRSDMFHAGTLSVATAGPAPTAEDVSTDPNSKSEGQASRIKRVVEPVPDRMVMNFKDDNWQHDTWYNKMVSGHQDRSRSMPVFSSGMVPVESEHPVHNKPPKPNE
jgi:hypothetical protein